MKNQGLKELKNKFPQDFKKVEKVAKLLKLDLITEKPNNGYFGYENGSTKIYISQAEDKLDAIIVATCSNCGDGSWISILK